MNILIKVITEPEFETLVKEKLKENWEKEINRVGTENLLSYIMTTGFPKFDNKNLITFVRALRGIMWIETVAVDTGDSNFYYLVSGTDAMLIRKAEVISA